ncbi:hypothetical protein ACX0HA_02620 [Flavobacterium hauense]
MKRLAFIILMTSLLLCSCSKKENLQPEKKTQDTIVVRDEQKDDYYAKIIEYRLVIAEDTSKTGIVFFQNKQGKLHLGLGLGMASQKRKYIENKPYRLRYLEVKKLMQEAAKDFDTKSLEDVGIGFLIETGDLAIDVSRNYYKKYGNTGRITWVQIGPKKREEIYEILITSRAGQDLNSLLTPFGKKIDKVTRAEQLQFLPKEAINYYTTYETEASQIPEFIMDAGLDFSVVDK